MQLGCGEAASFEPYPRQVFPSLDQQPLTLAPQEADKYRRLPSKVATAAIANEHPQTAKATAFLDLSK